MFRKTGAEGTAKGMKKQRRRQLPLPPFFPLKMDLIERDGLTLCILFQP